MFFDYVIDAIVILPEHIHLLMTPSKVKEYPRIIKAIKYNFSKRINLKEEVSQSFSRN